MMKGKIQRFLIKITSITLVLAPVLIPLLPVAFIVLYSFFPAGGENFKAYSFVFGESPIKSVNRLELQLKVLGNTVALGFLTVLWAGMFSIPSAFCIYKLPNKLNKFFRAILILPLLLPSYVIARAFMDVTLPDSTFSKIYEIFAGESFDYNNIFITALVLGVWLFPVMFMFMLEGLRRFDNRYVETTKMFAGKFFVFRKVTLPLLFPSYLSGAILIFILSMNNFGVPALFNITTLPTAIYITFDNYMDWRRFAVTAAQGVPLLIILIPAFLLLFKTETISNRYVVRSEMRKDVTERKRIKIFLRCIIPVLVFGISFILPFYKLAGRIKGFYIFKRAFESGGGDIIRSFLIAISAGLIAVIFWGIWAVILGKQNKRWAVILMALSVFPLTFPRVLVGLGISKMVGFSIPALIMSYVIIFMPFAVRAGYNAVREIHPALAEMLATTGMHKRSIFLRLYVPLTLKPLIGAGLLIAVFVFGEVVIGQIISPPGFSLISLRIYNLIHYSATEYVAALSIILMLITSTLYFIYLIFFDGEITRL